VDLPRGPSGPGTLAASVLCRELLAGPRTSLVGSHRGRASWLLSAPEPTRWVCVSTAEAVLLPCALVVGELPPAASSLSIGAGSLWYDDRPVAIRRWFTPPRVVPGCLAGHAAPPPRLRDWLTVWSDHLGEGEGLTPYGDDVICGVLLGLRATMDPRGDGLSRAVLGLDLPGRTTAVSAALLRWAAEGWCIPQVAAVVTALATGNGIAAAVDRLLDVGHSSGRGLWAGLSLVLPPRAGVAAA
jgi:uncharacterized protein DUF2877